MGAFIGKMLGWLVPEIIDMFERGIQGENLAHHWLMEKAPDGLKTEALDELWTEKRRREGKPT